MRIEKLSQIQAVFRETEYNINYIKQIPNLRSKTIKQLLEKLVETYTLKYPDLEPGRHELKFSIGDTKYNIFVTSHVSNNEIIRNFKIYCEGSVDEKALKLYLERKIMELS